MRNFRWWAILVALVGLTTLGVSVVRALGGPILSYEDPRGLYWYTVSQAQGNVFRLRVVVNTSTLENLQKYTELNRQNGLALAARGEKEIPVIATFTRPLSPSEFESLVAAAGLRVVSYTGRGRAGSGNGPSDKVTFQMGPKDGLLVDAAYIGDRLSRLDAKLAGLTSVRGYIDPSGLLVLLEDPRVFLADVMTLIVKEEVIRKLGLSPSADIRVSHQSPYWFVEKYTGADR